MPNTPHPVFDSNSKDLEARLRLLSTHASNKRTDARDDHERAYWDAAAKSLAVMAANLAGLRDAMAKGPSPKAAPLRGLGKRPARKLALVAPAARPSYLPPPLPGSLDAARAA